MTLCNEMKRQISPPEFQTDRCRASRARGLKARHRTCRLRQPTTAGTRYQWHPTQFRSPGQHVSEKKATTSCSQLDGLHQIPMKPTFVQRSIQPTNAHIGLILRSAVHTFIFCLEEERRKSSPTHTRAPRPTHRPRGRHSLPAPAPNRAPHPRPCAAA